jgi:hypothetical protein
MHAGLVEYGMAGYLSSFAGFNNELSILFFFEGNIDWLIKNVIAFILHRY